MLTNLLDSEPTQVCNFFSKYISWNSVFAANVARLATEFYAFNSVEKQKVASYIFAAAEDEFNDGIIPNERITHKELAWMFLTAVFDFYKLPLNNRVTCDIAFLNAVNDGYSTKNGLYHALGFHLGSEELAADEFEYLDILLKKHTKLYNHLLNFKFEKYSDYPGFNLGYRWIETHCTAEILHADLARKASNIIKEYKPDSYSEVISGYNYFKKVQEEFLSSI